MIREYDDSRIKSDPTLEEQKRLRRVLRELSMCAHVHDGSGVRYSVIAVSIDANTDKVQVHYSPEVPIFTRPLEEFKRNYVRQL